MRNYKLVIGFSAFGFLLSLISGFVSHSKLGMVFLHALLFAVVFAFLGFLLEFVFEHILQANLFSAPDSSGMEGVVQGASSGHGGSGHKVDFYVEDEDLPGDNEAPRFVVSYPRNIFSEMDEKSGSAAKNSLSAGAFPSQKSVSNSAENASSSTNAVSSAEQSLSKSTKTVETHDSSSATEAAHSPSSQGFVPISLGETPSTFSGTEAKKIEDLKPVNEVQKATQKASSGTDDDELDELPDMESLGRASPSYSSGGVVSDDDGIDGENSGNGQKSSSFLANEDINEFARGQDTQLMAKAISTLLASE